MRQTKNISEKFQSFTLIELLVVTSQLCRDFIHTSCFASAKTFSLFLKRKEGCGERGKTSFPGKRPTVGFDNSSLPAPLSPFQEKRKSFC